MQQDQRRPRAPGAPHGAALVPMRDDASCRAKQAFEFGRLRYLRRLDGIGFVETAHEFLVLAPELARQARPELRIGRFDRLGFLAPDGRINAEQKVEMRLADVEAAGVERLPR